MPHNLLHKFSTGVTDFNQGLLKFAQSPEGQMAFGLLSAAAPSQAPGGSGSRIGPAIQNVLTQQAQRGLFKADAQLKKAQAEALGIPKPTGAVTPMSPDVYEKLYGVPAPTDRNGNPLGLQVDEEGKVSVIGGGGQVINTVPPPPSNIQDMREAQLGIMKEEKAKAESARNRLRASTRMIQLLDSPEGIHAGLFAGVQQKMGALLAFLASGAPDAQKSKEINKFTNTAEYQAVAGTLVGDIIRLFGAGTGLSDADRVFAQQISGAIIQGETSPQVLRNIVMNHINNSTMELERYNQFITGVEESGIKNVRSLFPEIAIPTMQNPNITRYNREGNKIP